MAGEGQEGDVLSWPQVKEEGVESRVIGLSGGPTSTGRDEALGSQIKSRNIENKVRVVNVRS